MRSQASQLSFGRTWRMTLKQARTYSSISATSSPNSRSRSPQSGHASRGIDEVALFIAARGLERVLSRVAHDRKITLETKGKKEAAGESDLHSLIETMSRVRWKVKRTPLISKETRTLLQYIRTVRNSGAHRGDQEAESENLRQTASIIARTANRLWNAVAKSRARLDQTNIQRNWP